MTSPSDDEWTAAVNRRIAEAEARKPKRVFIGTGDPALRLALIDAGIISYHQLATAEEKLRVARETGNPAIADSRDRLPHTAGGSEEDPGPGDRRGA